MYLTRNHMVAYNTITMNEDAIFKALADATRRLILDEFAERPEQTLFELCSRLFMKHNVRASRQAITKHVSILQKAGLLRSERRGKYRVLIVDKKPISQLAERWLKLKEY